MVFIFCPSRCVYVLHGDEASSICSVIVCALTKRTVAADIRHAIIIFHNAVSFQPRHNTLQAAFHFLSISRATEMSGEALMMIVRIRIAYDKRKQKQQQPQQQQQQSQPQPARRIWDETEREEKKIASTKGPGNECFDRRKQPDGSANEAHFGWVYQVYERTRCGPM